MKLKIISQLVLFGLFLAIGNAYADVAYSELEPGSASSSCYTHRYPVCHHRYHPRYHHMHYRQHCYPPIGHYSYYFIETLRDDIDLDRRTADDVSSELQIN